MQDRRGFTLIELLVVIAVIALLAAILFPVFGTVREKTRQATCMTNLMRLTQATRQFHMDRDRYPTHLFGPAVCVDFDLPTFPLPSEHKMAPLSEVASRIAGNGRTPTELMLKRLYQECLWPVYIKDLSIYHCPNNTKYASTETSDFSAARLWKPIVSRTVPSWAIVGLYAYDSYDASPPIDFSSGKLIYGQEFQIRYARHWFPFNGQTPPPGIDPMEYRRQLIWREPEENSYLTMCVYHVEQTGMVPVAFLNGTVKVVPLATLKKMPDNGDPYRIPLPTKDARYWELKP